MNKNIEVINENLWVVNFDYVKLGYIQGLSFSNENGSDYAIFTQDGKMILNNKQVYYKDILAYMTVIMELPDRQLDCIQGFYCFLKKMIPKTKNFSDDDMEAFIEKMKLNETKKMFINLSQLKQNRRTIRKEYIKGNKKTIGIDKLRKIIIREKVK